MSRKRKKHQQPEDPSSSRSDKKARIEDSQRILPDSIYALIVCYSGDLCDRSFIKASFPKDPEFVHQLLEWQLRCPPDDGGWDSRLDVLRTTWFKPFVELGHIKGLDLLYRTWGNHILPQSSDIADVIKMIGDSQECMQGVQWLFQNPDIVIEDKRILENRDLLICGLRRLAKKRPKSDTHAKAIVAAAKWFQSKAKLRRSNEYGLLGIFEDACANNPLLAKWMVATKELRPHSCDNIYYIIENGTTDTLCWLAKVYPKSMKSRVAEVLSKQYNRICVSSQEMLDCLESIQVELADFSDSDHDLGD